jgi:hypothetical protein
MKNVIGAIERETGFDPKSPEAVVTLREANGPIFVDLLAIIGKSNNKTKKEIDAEADDAEKN